jgi:hypothetical protein
LCYDFKVRVGVRVKVCVRVKVSVRLIYMTVAIMIAIVGFLIFWVRVRLRLVRFRGG